MPTFNAEERIRGSVEFWRDRGTWRMLIRAPRWVIDDLVNEMHRTRPEGQPTQMVLGNWGGVIEAPTHSVVLCMPPKPGEPWAAEHQGEDE